MRCLMASLSAVTLQSFLEVGSVAKQAKLVSQFTRRRPLALLFMEKPDRLKTFRDHVCQAVETAAATFPVHAAPLSIWLGAPFERILMSIMAPALAAASRLLIGFGSCIATGSFSVCWWIDDVHGQRISGGFACCHRARLPLAHSQIVGVRQRGIGNWSATQRSGYRGRPEVAGRRSK